MIQNCFCRATGCAKSGKITEKNPLGKNFYENKIHLPDPLIQNTKAKRSHSHLPEL
jgi:hypothetical protein